MEIFRKKKDREGRQKASIWEMAINYFRHTQKKREYEREHGKAPILPDKDIAERVEKCIGCSYLIEEDISCSDCGCPITEKAEMSIENCPFGKWDGDPPVCSTCKRVECSCE